MNSFLRRINYVNEFNFNNVQYYADSLLTIYFAGDTVKWRSTRTPGIEHRAHRTDTTNSCMLLDDYDSLSILYNLPTHPTRCDTISPLPYQYDSRRRWVNVYGPTFIMTQFYRLPLLKQNNSLYLPMMTTAYHITWNYPGGFNGYCRGISIDTWNIPTVNLKSMLGVNDTFVIQRKRIELVH